MALIQDLKLPSSAPAASNLAQGLFSKGVISLINESNLPIDALKEAQNCMLYENGSAGPRWGVDWYGSNLPGNGPIDGGGSYFGVDQSVQLLVARGGVIYRSPDNGANWLPCNNASLTPGYEVTFVQANQATALTANYMFIVNGKDKIIRFDGTSNLTQFNAITRPVLNTIAKTDSINGTAYSYYYRITAVNNIGATIGSVTQILQTKMARGAWDPTNLGTSFATLTWTAIAGAVRYDIYLADNASDDAANNLFYLDSIGSTTYIDRGQVQTNPNSSVPIQDTTSGPTLGELAFVGSRLVGTRDPNNKYRVWWTGSGPYLGYFSDAYDGGYIDLQRGSQYYPVHVEDYRDGKGSPLITVWCNSSDGRGCIWQMSLDTATIQNTNYTQPNANKLPGSRGTNAPNSVVNVLNDYFFFNYQAWYNLGSRAQFLNLLSTDEISANIRPTLVNGTNPAASSSVTAFYYRAKVFCSLPRNSTVNNVIDIYDTERKAWITNAYTMGAKKFFQYSDSLGVQHLLFWKPGDTQLSETAERIKGDYGQPFTTSFTTGLIPVNPKNRFSFMFVEQADVEFSLPQGNIQIELRGIERNKGYSTQKTANITQNTTQLSTGWDIFNWDTTGWDVSGTISNIYSEASAKRYFTVSRELNAYQWQVTSNSLNSSWLSRQLQITGTLSDGSEPRQWRVKAT